jgi:hypothetical protein
MAARRSKSPTFASGTFCTTDSHHHSLRRRCPSRFSLLTAFMAIMSAWIVGGREVRDGDDPAPITTRGPLRISSDNV